MSAILLDDKIVHYEVLGRGRPVIFVHGWIGSWRYWVQAMQASSVSFRAYALDLWGFGDTARDPASYGLEQQALLLDRFLQEMGIAKVALIGHGLGALITATFTRRSPEMVDRLMCVDCPLDATAVNNRLRTDPPHALADWLTGNRNADAEPVRADAAKIDPQAITTSLTSMDNSIPNWMGDDMHTPCLVVHGQNDPAVATPPEDRVLTLPPRLHYIPLEQSGHFPMLDESPKFNRLVADFLALDSGISPRELQLKDEWKRRVR